MRLLFVSLLLAMSSASLAQSVLATPPMLVDPDTAAPNLLTHPGPLLPAEALTAQVFGDVRLQIVVTPNGHVTGITVLGGPFKLRDAAIDSVRKWVYQPFLANGQPVPATTVVTVSFSAATPVNKLPVRPLEDKFIAARDQCIQSLQTKGVPANQVALCVVAARQADALFADADASLARLQTYLYSATALISNSQFQDSLSASDKAISLNERGYGDIAVPCTLYVTKAEAEWGLRESASAFRDLNQAEDSERIAIQIVQSDSLKKEYSRILKNILGLHAQLLLSAGRADAARAKADEAAKL
jgi:TonB family protein